jgi:hypothetical protein
MQELNSETIEASSASDSSSEQSALIDVGMRAILMLTLAILLFSIPASNLLHPSPWQRSIGFWHSCFAFLATGFSVATGLLLFPLLKGNLSILRALVISAGSSVTTLLALLTGLIAYARYNAPVADAPGVYIRVVSPLMQTGMIWHQLTSLSLFSVEISVFFCLWVYGRNLLKSDYAHAQLRSSLYVCFGLILFLTLSETIVGIALAKFHAL